MKVSDVISISSMQIEETYSDADWIKYINMGLDDLIPAAKILKQKTGVAVTWTSNNGIVTIADDADLAKSYEFLNVYHEKTTITRLLRRLPVDDNVSEGWKLISGQIILHNITDGGTGDTIRVDYYQRLQYVTSIDDDLKTVALLPEQYHSLLVSFCGAKSQQKEEELQDKSDLYGEYMLGKRQMAIDRMWEMEPKNRKFIKKARIAQLIGGTQG